MVETTTPAASLKRFQMENVAADDQPQRIFLSRIDRLNELKNDVLSVYKNPNTNLRAMPKVQFEDESAVGSRPTTEFLSIAMKVLEEGIDDPATSKVILFLKVNKTIVSLCITNASV